MNLRSNTMPGLALVAATCGEGFAQLSSVSGTVRGPGGSAVPSAAVEVLRVADFVRSPDGRPTVVPSSRIARSGVTGGDGTFSFGGLPAGDYYICARSNGQPLLGSCDWTQMRAVNLQSGSSVTGLAVSLAAAAVLTLRVADPSGRLTGTNYVFGAGVVSPDGYYERLTFESRSLGVAYFQVLVPPSASLWLIVDTDLAVEDAAGVVPARVPSRLVGMGGRQEVTIDLQVQ